MTASEFSPLHRSKTLELQLARVHPFIYRPAIADCMCKPDLLMGTVCRGFILESDVGVEQLANQKVILPIRLLSDPIIYPEKDQREIFRSLLKLRKCQVIEVRRCCS